MLKISYEDCGDYYLWLGDRYETLPALSNGGPVDAGTKPPVSDGWTSPFLGKTAEDVAFFVKAAPKPLNRVHFAILDPELWFKHQVLVCKVVESGAQAIPCAARDVGTTLVGYVRETLSGKDAVIDTMQLRSRPVA